MNRICPNCRSEIDILATKCPNCLTDFRATTQSDEAATAVGVIVVAILFVISMCSGCLFR